MAGNATPGPHDVRVMLSAVLTFIGMGLSVFGIGCAGFALVRSWTEHGTEPPSSAGLSLAAAMAGNLASVATATATRSVHQWCWRGFAHCGGDGEGHGHRTGDLSADEPIEKQVALLSAEFRTSSVLLSMTGSTTAPRWPRFVTILPQCRFA